MNSHLWPSWISLKQRLIVPTIYLDAVKTAVKYAPVMWEECVTSFLCHGIQCWSLCFRWNEPSMTKQNKQQKKKKKKKKKKKRRTYVVASSWASEPSDHDVCYMRSVGILGSTVSSRKQRILARLGRCPGWFKSASLGTQSFCWFHHVLAQMLITLSVCPLGQLSLWRIILSVFVYPFFQATSPKGELQLVATDRSQRVNDDCYMRHAKAWTSLRTRTFAPEPLRFEYRETFQTIVLVTLNMLFTILWMHDEESCI